MQSKPQAKMAEVLSPAVSANVNNPMGGRHQPQPLDEKALQQVGGGRLNPYNNW